MKKLFTLLALMCMICTGAWAEEAKRITNETSALEAGALLTVADLTNLSGTGKHFAFVNTNTAARNWNTFGGSTRPENITKEQLYTLVGGSTDNTWKVKNYQGAVLESPTGVTFTDNVTNGFDWYIVQDGDTKRINGKPECLFQLRNSNSQQYRVDNKSFGSYPGDWARYYAYGPFYFVTIEYVYRGQTVGTESIVLTGGTFSEAPEHYVPTTAVNIDHDGNYQVNVIPNELVTSLNLYSRVPGYPTAASDQRKALYTAINSALISGSTDNLTAAVNTYSNLAINNVDVAGPQDGVTYYLVGVNSNDQTRRYIYTGDNNLLKATNAKPSDLGEENKYEFTAHITDGQFAFQAANSNWVHGSQASGCKHLGEDYRTSFTTTKGNKLGRLQLPADGKYFNTNYATANISETIEVQLEATNNNDANNPKKWSTQWEIIEKTPAILPLYTVVVTGAPKDNAGVKISETIIAKDGAQIYYDENFVLEGAEVEGAQTPTITVDKTAQTITVEYTMTINFTLLNRHGDGTHSGLDGLTVGTFSAPYDVKLSGDVEAYTAVREGDILYFEPIGNIVPANEGVLLYAEGYKVNYDGAATYTEAEAPVVTNNVLKPLLANATVEAGDYVLTNAYNGVGFYPRATATTASNKAYIPAEVGAGIRGFVFGNEDGLTTAISQLSVQSSKHAAFDLAGRRINAAVKGISIVNGKKFIK